MKELDVVKLKENFEDLKIGTEGTIVYEHGKGCYEVEFFDDNKDTIGIYTIEEKYLELIVEFK